VVKFKRLCSLPIALKKSRKMSVVTLPLIVAAIPPLGGQCSRLVRRLYEAAATVPAAELSMSRRAQSTGGRQIVFTRVYIKGHTWAEPEPWPWGVAIITVDYSIRCT